MGVGETEEERGRGAGKPKVNFGEAVGATVVVGASGAGATVDAGTVVVVAVLLSPLQPVTASRAVHGHHHRCWRP